MKEPGPIHEWYAYIIPALGFAILITSIWGLLVQRRYNRQKPETAPPIKPKDAFDEMMRGHDVLYQPKQLTLADRKVDEEMQRLLAGMPFADELEQMMGNEWDEDMEERRQKADYSAYSNIIIMASWYTMAYLPKALIILCFTKGKHTSSIP